jgi:hypothetical protein
VVVSILCVGAERSYPVATRGQWAELGVSEWQLRQRVKNGELLRIRRDVYADAAEYSKSSPARKHAFHVTAAMLATSGTASHTSAAILQGLDLLARVPADLVTLTRAPSTRGSRSSLRRIKIHAARLPSDHVTTRYGRPVTSPARTVIDLARTMPFMHGVVTADSALHKGRASREELASVLAACQGWPGSANAARVVRFSDGRAESPLESCARVIFARYGLPPPELQVEIRGQGFRQGFLFRVDFLWPQFSTISEADGLGKYEKNAALATAQLERDQLLREAGHKVVHFTWEQLFRETLRVISWHKSAFAHATAM